MSDAKTKEYLTNLRADKTDALRQIFFAYHPMVFRKIMGIVKDANLADDLAQEVFIKIWKKRRTLAIKTSFLAYLLKMATNEALGHLRSQTAQTFSFQEDLDSRQTSHNVESELIAEEMSNKIAHALKQLPPKCREIFLLSREDGLTYQQIAIDLAISKKTVENQMGKALKLLRAALLGIGGLILLHQLF